MESACCPDPGKTRRRCRSSSGPWGAAATRTATSAKSWARTSCGCLLPVRDPFFGGAVGIADAALDGVCGALDQEVGRRRCQDVLAVQRQPPLLAVDPAHPPDKGLGRRTVGLVRALAQVRAGAARA